MWGGRDGASKRMRCRDLPFFDSLLVQIKLLGSGTWVRQNAKRVLGRLVFEGSQPSTNKVKSVGRAGPCNL